MILALIFVALAAALASLLACILLAGGAYYLFAPSLKGSP